MEALRPIARAPPRRTEWSVEECALFAARREFELLKLLSSDKKALATARRLGFSSGGQQRPRALLADAAPARASRAVGTQHPPAPPRANARQRRSAERSARRHAARQRRLRATALAVLFLSRLRRRARLRRDLQDLEELADAAPTDALAKRGRSSRGSSSASSSATSSPLLHSEPVPPAVPGCWGVTLPQPSLSHRAKRAAAQGGLARGFLLR